MGKSANIFDAEAERYGAWFDSLKGRVLFENELAAVRLLRCSDFRPALEVGLGTARFAQAIGLEFGIDPAAGALRLAERKIRALAAGCSPDEIRHVVLLATTTLGFPSMMAVRTWVEDVLGRK